jgi:ABC-type glycerol-3-phosphate transport system permease component
MRRKIRLTAADKLFHAVVYTILIFAGVVVLLPLLNIIAMSLSEPREVLGGRVLFWPRYPTLQIYELIMKNKVIITGYANTLFYAAVGTAVNLVMTFLCAYPLSRTTLMGKGPITLIFTFTMLFGGGMIPTYILIRNLGLLDTRAVMILPGAMSVWNMILARTFFQNTIPKEMYESAELDGASHARVLVSIVIPLSVPIIAVLTLFYAVGHWNSFFNAVLYLRSQNLYNIQMVLRIAISNIQYLINSTGDLARQEQTMAVAEASKYVIIVISMLPVLIIYPFVQKHFIKGIMIGALKG